MSIAAIFFEFVDMSAAMKFRSFSVIGMVMGLFSTCFYIQQIDEVKLTE
jgi:hypothetical protein